MARTALPAILSAIALATIAAPAAAQVNIEALRADIGDRKYFLSIAASFTGHAGNGPSANASGTAFAGFQIGDHLLFARARGDYGQFKGEATATKAFGHLRYNYRFLPWLFGEAFLQIEEDKFQRLAIRQLTGAGVRFGIVQRKEIELYYGTAWMADYSKLNDDPVPLGTFVGPHWWAQRWSNYLSSTWHMSARARISEALYVQPRVNAFKDFRLLSDTAFVVDVDKRLSVKISARVLHNNTPPSRVLATDVDVLTSLVLTL
jgi:putative salt-induced outer membrane protein YdiY